MAQVTAAAVKSLRDRTNLPMMECKKALVEADGDEDKAIEMITAKMRIKVGKRADNEAKEGRVFAETSENGNELAVVELRCESEPVAGSPQFTELGHLLVKTLLSGPGATTPDELLAQNDESGTPLSQRMDDVVTKIQEKFDLTRVARHTAPFGVYVHHNGKTAAVMCAEGAAGDAETLKGIAAHIAAMKPEALTTDDVDPAKAQVERDRLTDEAKSSGKPDNIVEKIVDGQMNRWYKEDAGVLVEQAYVYDDSKTVGQVLAEKGLSPKHFDLFVIG